MELQILKKVTELIPALMLTSAVTTALFISRKTKLTQVLLSGLHFLRIQIEDFILFAFTAAWVISLGAPYGLLIVWRAIVWSYLRIRYGPLGDLVAALDVIGTMDIDNSRQIIKSLKVLEGVADLPDLRKRIEATVGRKDPARNGRHVYPKFYQYLSHCGMYLSWKPSNFDIEHHVRYLDGLDENSPSMSETEALDRLGKISNDKFQEGRAHWEILVIPKFHYDNDKEKASIKYKFALLFRIHHGIGDGYSLLKFITRDMTGNPFIPTAEGTGKKEDKDMVGRPTVKTNWFYGAAVFFYILLKGPRIFYWEMIHRDDNPLHRNGVEASGKKSMIWSKPIPVDFLKETKNKLKSGMSTIMLSAFAGALGKYIKEEFGEDPPEITTSVMPVPAPNHPDNAMVNKFSIILFPLCTQLDDPVERCREIDRQGKLVAKSPQAVMNLFLMNLTGVLPVFFSRPTVTNYQSTVVVSNIPGPSESIDIWGKKLLDTMFWLPHLATSGISISFLSYETHLRVGLTVDSGFVPDGKVGAERLVEGMIQELLKMAKGVNVSSSWISESPSIPDDDHKKDFPSEKDKNLNETRTSDNSTIILRGKAPSSNSDQNNNHHDYVKGMVLQKTVEGNRDHTFRRLVSRE